MLTRKAAPKLFIPSLQPLYDVLVPLSWPLVRCAAGLILAVHGWAKVERGPEAYVPIFVGMGYESPVPLIVFLTFVEFVGGLCVALGLFTRIFASMIAIELLWITFHHYLPKGFNWANGGYEYTLMWGLIALAIWWRGGGPYSLDRLIGREL